MDTTRRIDRLDLFAQYKSFNDLRITKDCGLALGTIGKARKPGKDISLTTARRILDAYPDLNRIWFLTGNGDMLTENDTPDYTTYPLIDTTKAQCGRAVGLADAAKINDLPRIALPGIPRETEFFIQAAGYSMVNNDRPDLSIPPGALVGLSKVNTGYIRWGEAYAIVTNDGIMIKRLFPDTKNPELVKCVSYNSNEFPEFSIPNDEIKEVARITCVVPVMVR
ncbi:MAG: S24 family peptidase [Prevotella sp.]|nr:S24 family peptidase [Bacteroides sp.]MCM1366133.1 S24 family peptidase [Prevotella sp.]MCM1436802.1 S24 family peptidase [Prevotella sp.]